ncbi:MAG: tRNA (5-methylaminomethyl-2-thiouridine)(34)-methyltransferase MnmD [Bacteroidetes bacterium]|nr:tRNA (5-methylaminomethyl-2-thiouridine)(34)-methyltransferase MnmD [Bacteroidota bacterium]MCB9225753.1 tRNA (5-methylaminomethyl-2-thiouridine)(34)-methyltransferase MnmD [Chitinophagales bacterium]
MEKIATKDGSFTVKHAQINELYHSIHGAMQESKHVFIENGIALHKNKQQVSVFEMGLGTGLNALLTYKFAKENKIKVTYYCIEAYPMLAEDALQLNYTNTEDELAVFKQIHESEWNKVENIDEHFSLFKIKGKLEYTGLSFLKGIIDVIYFDAFAPTAQEELWQPDILSKMYGLLKTEGHLTTYCAKGQFKRDLKNVGFTVKAVAGPPGKREMTLAYKE